MNCGSKSIPLRPAKEVAQAQPSSSYHDSRGYRTCQPDDGKVLHYRCHRDETGATMFEPIESDGPRLVIFYCVNCECGEK
jgi:hypothetical protein